MNFDLLAGAVARSGLAVVGGMDQGLSTNNQTLAAKDTEWARNAHVVRSCKARSIFGKNCGSLILRLGLGSLAGEKNDFASERGYSITSL
jgi:hypothetical protein